MTKITTLCQPKCGFCVYSEFESDKAQYSSPFFYWLFLIGGYWNPKSRQGPGLAGLASRGAPVHNRDSSLHDLYEPTLKCGNPIM